MKIGLVTPYDWSYPGGVRDHVWYLANEFMALGHDVRILAPASGPKRKIPEKHIYKMGVTTPIPANGSIARVVVFDPALTLRVRKVLQRENFDILSICFDCAFFTPNVATPAWTDCCLKCHS